MRSAFPVANDEDDDHSVCKAAGSRPLLALNCVKKKFGCLPVGEVIEVSRCRERGTGGRRSMQATGIPFFSPFPPQSRPCARVVCFTPSVVVSCIAAAVREHTPRLD